MDAAAAFLASLEESKITTLQDAAKKPPIEILPPGMASLYGPNPGQSGQKKPGLALQQSSKPLLLEASASTTESVPASSDSNILPSTESGPSQNSAEVHAPTPISESASATNDSVAPPQSGPDPSASLVTESSDHGPPSNHDNVENQDQSAPIESVAQSNGAEGSVPLAPGTTVVAPDVARQQGTGVRAELSMIDFT